MFNYFLQMCTKINLTILLVDLPLVFFVFKAITIGIKNYKSPFVLILCAYGLFVLLSIIAYGFNDTPLICYFLGVQYYFIPICFALLGYSYSTNYEYNKFYIYACAACFVIGFYLYATLPPTYVEFIAKEQDFEGWSQKELFGMTRFSSFLPGSYNISFLSVPALVLSLAYSSNSNAGVKRWMCYFIAGVSLVAAILCQQRIAMFSAIAVVLFYSLYFFKQGNKQVLLASICIVVLLIAVLYFFVSDMVFYDVLQERILDRFHKMKVSTAMSIREGQYSGFSRDTWWSYLIGLGMGSCGHLVIPYNLQAIYDGEYVKTFYEFGLVGVTIFAILILMTLLRGLKLFRYLNAEVLIMLFFLGACVGASALTFFIYSSMFWFTLGRIWNKDYLALRRQEMLKV